MAEFATALAGMSEPRQAAYSHTPITDELNEILTLLRQAFPDAAAISLDFDGRLHVHIDVRKREQVTLVQAVLPTLEAATFASITLRSTPHHPFLHRVSALVSR
jgi:hypothetical protein